MHSAGLRPCFSCVSIEDRIAASHPLRRIRKLADQALDRLSPTFCELYAAEGRPSVPPEQLLLASLLQAFYGIRSERLLLEQLHYNLLFRWFVGLSPDDPIWHPTTFTKNRDRLLNEQIMGRFLMKLVGAPEVKPLLSNEHVSVDGPAAGLGLPCLAGADRWSGRPTASAISPRRRVAADIPGAHRKTLGADKNDDTKGMVADLRWIGVAPHVAQNTARLGGSAIDGRTTRHEGYAKSINARRGIEKVFGWIKQWGGLRQFLPRPQAERAVGTSCAAPKRWVQCLACTWSPTT